MYLYKYNLFPLLSCVLYFLLVITSEYYAYPQTKFLHSPFYWFSLSACSEQSYDSMTPAGFGAYYP